jgi:hypothetical protein
MTWPLFLLESSDALIYTRSLDAEYAICGFSLEPSNPWILEPYKLLIKRSDLEIQIRPR